MSYRRFKPIDPRDAFGVSGAEAAGSQAAFLLAVRAGVLGHASPMEKLPEFPLPNLKALRSDRHVKVATACQHLGVSEKELQKETRPALEQEMTKAAREVYKKPTIEAAAALFEAAMMSSHPLVAVAGAAG
ncbi:MAG: hypothetical protein OEM99_16580, partial [Gammaproteobacteria bacterium]|nr:hypothetical protein [Gammaproteobacteria bacterium]